MKTLKMNIEKSKQMYEVYKHLIKKKQCYDNVYRIMEKNYFNMAESIAFCYVNLNVEFKLDGEEVDGFTRHAAFIINDEIVDPTLYMVHAKKSPDLLKKLSEEGSAYIVFKEYTSKAYLDKLLNMQQRNGGVTTSLDGKIEEEMACVNELRKERNLIF